VKNAFKTNDKTTQPCSRERSVKVTSPAKARAHVFISGGVQGVFFRSETRLEAKKRSVSGWIRNLPDGRVEAIFEGEEAHVKELVEFCRRGPPGARVTGTNVEWETYTGKLSDFEVRNGFHF
jgi:acylphosphatase